MFSFLSLSIIISSYLRLYNYMEIIRIDRNA